MRDELDPSCLMDCPETGCNGFLMRISLPNEKPVTYKCVICGLITWFLPEVQGHTGEPIHTLTAKIFQDWTQ